MTSVWNEFKQFLLCGAMQYTINNSIASGFDIHIMWYKVSWIHLSSHAWVPDRWLHVHVATWLFVEFKPDASTYRPLLWLYHLTTEPHHLSGQAPLLSVDFGVDFWSFLLVFDRFRPSLVKNGQNRLEIGSSCREEHSMDQYRSRPKLSENFEGHWSIPFPGEIHTDRSMVHTFSWEIRMDQWSWKFFKSFPHTLALVHG